jgi:Icc-related predicted phosphoesterase
MKCLVISDTHRQHLCLNIPNDIDTIIHAGDFSHNVGQFFDFIEWYGSLNIANKILVAGNHDLHAEKLEKGKLKEFCSSLGITYLQDDEVIIDGIKFYGSPYSNIFGRYAFMLEDFELEEIWEKIPNDTNVLITHGPAYKTGDYVNNGFSSERHVGSRTLQNRLLELNNLEYHIFGHIHESYGIYHDYKFTSINASIFNYREPLNEPIIIEIKEIK